MWLYVRKTLTLHYSFSDGVVSQKSFQIFASTLEMFEMILFLPGGWWNDEKKISVMFSLLEHIEGDADIYVQSN